MKVAISYLFLFITFAGYTQSDGLSRITGVVFDSLHTLSGIKLELSKDDNSYLATTLSDTNGYYEFDSIKSGIYSITVTDSNNYVMSIIDINAKVNSDISLNIEFEVYKDPYQQSDALPRCHICHKKDRVIPVVTGYPISKEELKAAQKGKIIHNGCVSFARWYCKRDQVYVEKE